MCWRPGERCQVWAVPATALAPGAWESICVDAPGAMSSVSGYGNRPGPGSLREHMCWRPGSDVECERLRQPPWPRGPERTYGLTPREWCRVWAVTATALAPGAWENICVDAPGSDVECERLRQPPWPREPERTYGLTPRERCGVWAVPATALAPGAWENMCWRPGSDVECERFRQPPWLRGPERAYVLTPRGAMWSVSGSGNRPGPGGLREHMCWRPGERCRVWAVPGTALAPGAWESICVDAPGSDVECERFRQPPWPREPERAYVLTPRERCQVWAVPATALAPGAWESICVDAPGSDVKCERFRQPPWPRGPERAYVLTPRGAMSSVSGSGNRPGPGGLREHMCWRPGERCQVWAVPGTALAPGAWESICVDAPGVVSSVKRSGTASAPGAWNRVCICRHSRSGLDCERSGTALAPGSWNRVCICCRSGSGFEC